MHKGIAIAVMTTPLDERLHPDWNLMEQIVERLSASPIDGIFPCASTGEFIHFSAKENIRLLQCAAYAAKGRKKCYAGICAPNVRQSVAYMEHAKKLGYHACVACPPYYYPLSQEEVLVYYQTLCKAAEGMPVIAYHVPFFTTGIGLDTFGQLLDTTPLAGMKDSSGDLKRIGHVVRLAGRRRDFVTYTGTDDCLLGALAMGCGGSMTAFGGSLPDHIAALYRVWRQGDTAAAQRLQRQMMPLLALADSLPFPLGYKLVAELTMHLPRGNYLQPCDPETVEVLRGRMREALDGWEDML